MDCREFVSRSAATSVAPSAKSTSGASIGVVRYTRTAAAAAGAASIWIKLLLTQVNVAAIPATVTATCSRRMYGNATAYWVVDPLPVNAV